MVKSDNQNVNIPCFGNIRGCKANHCNIAYYCRETTESKEAYVENCIEDKVNDEIRGE